MTGTADLLRGLLMVQSGVAPDGLTEVLRQAIDQARGTLQASDVVRMLALLSEAEGSIRRSTSARLVVETLLLRWTLMDRVIELEAVIAGLPAGASHPGTGGGPGTGPSERPAPTAAPVPAPRPAPKPSGEALSLASLLAVWPEVLADAGGRSKLLEHALAATTPVAAGNGEVRLSAKAGQEGLAEGAGRQAAVVEELIAARFGGPVTVRLVTEAPRGAPAAPPLRMTDSVLKAERLDRLRRLDPALDTAANELDLEIVDGDSHG
jgi:DNA polymerase III gamma/tau subunit